MTGVDTETDEILLPGRMLTVLTPKPMTSLGEVIRSNARHLALTKPIPVTENKQRCH